MLSSSLPNDSIEETVSRTGVGCNALAIALEHCNIRDPADVDSDISFTFTGENCLMIYWRQRRPRPAYGNVATAKIGDSDYSESLCYYFGFTDLKRAANFAVKKLHRL